MITLNDKVTLVTGGSRGIGAAIAELLSEAGATVIITYATQTREAKNFVNRMERWGRTCSAIKVNVLSERSIRKTIAAIIKEYGRIDILVNNAGIWKHGSLGSLTTKKWEETIDVNLRGTFIFCREVARTMKAHGGKIVNISSTAGQRGEAEYSHYAASKGGIIAFTKSIGAELAPFKINVNCVAPGWVDTNMTEATLGKRSTRRAILKTILIGKIAKPTDIAGPVLFLCSHLSDHMVGAVLNVNGGSVMD